MTAPSPAERFVAYRDIAAVERIGDGGRDLCSALTAALDDAITELAAPLAGQPLAVVAVGGYGRGEQCLYSDVDLMLLHADADLDLATEAVLYPLWDAKLKVGHSVRTVREAVAAAREDFETLTSMLTMRCIAGDATLVAALEGRIAGVLEGRPLAPLLAEHEWGRRRLEPYPVMAADLKEGRGGLRTFQGFVWERRRAALVWDRRDTALPEEAAAHEELLSVRNALHAVARGPSDVFVADVREAAADWLGCDEFEIASRVCRSLATGDRLAERRWPDLVGGRGDPMVALGRGIFGRITSRFRRAPSPPHPVATTPLGLAVRAAARPEGVWLDTVETERIRSAEPAGWTDDDRNAFIRLLAAGERGRAAWGLLDELGWVDAHLPEWTVVRHLPQLAAFHDHPVDAHLWRTVDAMQQLASGSGKLGEIADEVGSTEELMLAAFFHDIGKGRGGNHSDVGAGIANRVLHRLGFGPATTAVVTTAVRHHLLLTETATRRDLDDPQVIARVVDAAGDLRTLQLLYLLAIADAEATGAGTWNSWKETLLGRLYEAAAEMLGVGGPPQPDKVAAAIAATAGRFPADMVEEHLAAMSDDYLATVPVEEIGWHLDLLARTHSAAGLDARAGEGYDRVLVVGADRTGFLGAVAAVFAGQGVSIVGAKLFTRSDGTAIDEFQVVDDRTGEPVAPERWRRIERDLVDAVQGTLDPTALLASRARVYRNGSRPTTPVRVTLPEGASSRFTVVEVRCPDRIGRLAEIAAALYGAGLDIALARLDTRAGEVIDTFYVRRDGHPIRDPAEQRGLIEALEAALG